MGCPVSTITAKFKDGTRFRARDGSQVWECECPFESIFLKDGEYVLVETHWRVDRKPVPKFVLPHQAAEDWVKSGVMTEEAARRTSFTRTARRVTKREAIRRILRGVLQDRHANDLLEALGLQDGAKTALVTPTPHRSGRVRLEVHGRLADEVIDAAKSKGITPSAALREVMAMAEQKFGGR